MKFKLLFVFLLVCFQGAAQIERPIESNSIYNNAMLLAPSFIVESCAEGLSDQIVEAPVRVKNFTDLLTFQMSLVIGDASVAAFEAIEPGPALPNNFTFGITHSDSASVSWFSADFNPVTLPDDSIAFILKLRLTGTENNCADIFFSGSPTLIEVVQDQNGAQVIVTPVLLDGCICETSSSLLIQPTVYLQGAYNSISGLMPDILRAGAILPFSEPYSALGYTHVGGGGENAPPTTFNQTGADAIVDWVFLELRDKSDFSIVSATRSALLQRDGDVVDMDGSSPVSFADLSADDYYLVVKHRNHVGTMSAAPIAFSNTPTTVDFTSDLNLIFGGVNGIANLSDGRLGLYSGDFDRNGQVQNTDVNFMTPTLGTTGYLPGDLDLNGQVQNTDLQLKLLPNIGKGQSFGQ